MERYLTFPRWCKEHYGRKLYRAALSAGMTCPNRDGKIDTRGCIFCLGGSGDFSVEYDGRRMGREDLVFNHHEAQPGDYIAYFQSYTNTYAPVERLRFLFESALRDALFGGISVATRPDCIDEDIASLFAQLRKEYPDKLIMVELGLQTVHESSAAWMRRGYSLPVFEKAVRLLHEADVNIVVHVIIGLPGETKQMMYETVRSLNRYNIQGVKLQLLHYLKGTDLGTMYEENPEQFHVLTLEEYTEIISECIAILNPDIVIHRLTGDGNGEALLAPLWSRDKRHVLNMIRHELKTRNIIQGCHRDNE